MVSLVALLMLMALRWAYLLLHFPHALHTAEQVAAPQHDAANVASYNEEEWLAPALPVAKWTDEGAHTVLMLGRARSGIESSAPILTSKVGWFATYVYVVEDIGRSEPTCVLVLVLVEAERMT